MDTKNTLILISILLNAVGAILMFVFGRTPVANDSHGTFLFQEEELKEMNRVLGAKQKRYRSIALIGLLIMLGSIVIQVYLMYA